MAKGRKALPGKIHQLHGSYRGDRHGGEMQVETILPDPPDRLSDEAKAEWERLAPELHKLGILTALDLAILEAYCNVFARYLKAERRLAEIVDGELSVTPNGYEQQSAWFQVANICIKQMQSLCSEFGLTPATRARLKMISSKPKQLDLLKLLDDLSKEKASKRVNG